jgi:hypothetical protein
MHGNAAYLTDNHLLVIQFRTGAFNGVHLKACKGQSLG